MHRLSTRREFLGAVGTGALLTATATQTTATERAATDNWSMAGFDLANTGYNPEAPGPQANVGATWSQETAQTADPVTSSVLVVADIVFVTTPGGTISAHDIQTGEQLWSIDIGSRIRGTPTVVDDHLVVGDDDGIVYAIDTDGETIDWTMEVDGAVRTSPAVTAEYVYVGTSAGTIYGLARDDGEVEWTATAEATVEADPAVDTDRGFVYIGSDDGRLYALDTQSGDREWAFGTDSGDPVRSAPVIGETQVYVGGGGIDQQIYALDPDSGTIRWQERLDGAVVNSPAIGNGNVYVPVRDGSIVAFDSAGTRQWTYDTDGIPTAPAVGRDHLYVGGQGGSVEAVDLDGEGVWQLDTGAAVESSPTVVGEGVYIANNSGTVAALGSGGEPVVGNGIGNGEDDGFGPSDLRFLVWPASILTFIGMILGVFYVATRLGLLDRIEAAADSVEPTVVEEAEEDTDEEVDTIWNLVVEDVIDRASATDTTATQDIRISKYVDQGTLESPVVAYEIESYRDEPVTVTVTEPRFEGANPEEAAEMAQPRGRGWTVSETELVYETSIEPGETVKTIIGRPDCADGDIDSLVETPRIEILE